MHISFDFDGGDVLLAIVMSFGNSCVFLAILYKVFVRQRNAQFMCCYRWRCALSGRHEEKLYICMEFSVFL